MGASLAGAFMNAQSPNWFDHGLAQTLTAPSAAPPSGTLSALSTTIVNAVADAADEESSKVQSWPHQSWLPHVRIVRMAGAPATQGRIV
jgi:hypothetical protein